MSEPSARILVVDDEPAVRRMLRRYLEGEGFAVHEAEDLPGVERALEGGVDLVTLDLNLDGCDGLAIARAVRETSPVPIIIITGKSDMVDKVVGLELGADDYVAKPFHLREVLARIRSVLRRSRADQSAGRAMERKAESENAIAFDGYRLEFNQRELVGPSGASCDLTTAEFDLLAVFVRHANRVLDRDLIMDLLKGRDWTPTDRTIDNQVARLRKKIEDDPSRPRLIKTVRGIGYCFAPRAMHKG
ncbi:response regulator [Pararhizobium haloflavum]|uniref:response regulator n=1 Tax=Pararhizobium haloflavum TaxID=2037914 RepID=UPI000C1965E7|nr:response regulator [Pararhizobium haloflavum]